MTEILIIFGVTLCIMLIVRTLNKKNKGNYYVREIIGALCCIILFPLLLVAAFIRTTWKLVLYGIHGVIND